MPKVIQVIESDIVRGKGAPGDSFRRVTQYHTLEGEFLAENDPCDGLKSEVAAI